jgi:hypothetical protein
MLYLTLGLFALAAVFGLLLVKNLLATGKTPRGVVYTHGLFAASGLVLLLVKALQHPAQSLTTSLVFFVIAALGGFFLFFRDLAGRSRPIWLAIVHGLLAVTGFIILLMTIL